ncbi:hypothetical protein EVAR_4822_1 [Eumeta japonica]|uniref:Uncharacterized protein n=1 Tax=Eumeta variegata TaxID=151549 RepID=A0A4C1SZW0_EUMVA|nr:hypothetical protein EVAR_4822_1 [Eumeta japonica]
MYVNVSCLVYLPLAVDVSGVGTVARSGVWCACGGGSRRRECARGAGGAGEAPGAGIRTRVARAAVNAGAALQEPSSAATGRPPLGGLREHPPQIFNGHIELMNHL